MEPVMYVGSGICILCMLLVFLTYTCCFRSASLPLSAALVVFSFILLCLCVVGFCVSHRLVGLVVNASASRVEDPGFESRLRRDFPGSSCTSDLKIGTPVATLPGAWCYRVSAGTGWPGVSILWLGEMESLICTFYLSVAACRIVWADLSLKYTCMLLGCLAPRNKQIVCVSLGRLLRDQMGWGRGGWTFSSTKMASGTETETCMNISCFILWILLIGQHILRG